MVFITSILAAIAAPLLAAVATAGTSISAYLAANGAALAARVAPLAAFALLFAVEYGTGDAWERSRVVALAISAVVASLDVAGKLPTITLPAEPANPTT